MHDASNPLAILTGSPDSQGDPGVSMQSLLLLDSPGSRSSDADLVQTDVHTDVRHGTSRPGISHLRAVPRQMDVGLPVNRSDPVFSEGAFDGPQQLQDAIDALAACHEVWLDFETTGLTPWSLAQRMNRETRIGAEVLLRDYERHHACTSSGVVRARVLSFRPVLWLPGQDSPSGRFFAFDLDRLDEAQRAALAQGFDGKIWGGHNLYFEAQWMRQLHPDVRYKAILDTMLMSTCFRPTLEFELHDQIDAAAQDSPGEVPDLHGLPDWTPQRGKLIGALLYKMESRARHRKDSEERGVSLDFLSHALLSEQLDKSFQPPHNWTPEKLSAAHHAYCAADIDSPMRIARRLLGLPDFTRTKELMARMASMPGAAAYGVAMRAIPRLVDMQYRGLFVNAQIMADYVASRRSSGDAILESILRDEPDLRPFRESMRSGGQTEAYKSVLSQVLERRGGRPLEKTATGANKLDAKTLARLYPELTIRRQLQSMNAAYKSASMGEDYLSVARRSPDHCLHSMVSPVAVTLRTTSAEPNIQNAPSKDADFRRAFTAPDADHCVVSVDFSAIEMVIAAALSWRTYQRIRALFDAAQTVRRAPFGPARDRALERYASVMESGRMPKWLFGFPGKAWHEDARGVDWPAYSIPPLIDWMSGDWTFPGIPRDGDILGLSDILECKPDAGSATMGDWRLYYSAMLFDLLLRVRSAGGFQDDSSKDRLTLLSAFQSGVDPHMVTAIDALRRAGRFDTQNMSPLDYLTACTPERRAQIRAEHKDARDRAKAPNFGLLYGMSATGGGASRDGGLYAYGVEVCGIDWTPEDAEQSAAMWFDLYPEIALMHFMQRRDFIHCAQISFGSEPSRPRRAAVMAGGVPPGKYYRNTTLSGRPVASRNWWTAINHADQGTGAEIALRAIAEFPQDIADGLRAFVHDEFVFHFPIARAREMTDRAKAAMIAAAQKYIGFSGCPVRVEDSIDSYWHH